LNVRLSNSALMTRRHNKLANDVWRGIEKFLRNDLRSAIQENEVIVEDGLSDKLGRLRPAIVFEWWRIRPIGAP
jgi:hypothetical protein